MEDSAHPTSALVIFSESRVRRLGLRRTIRVWRRFPALAYSRTFSAVVSLLTGSRICHCAFVWEGRVYDHTLSGFRSFDADAYCRAVRIICAVVVPLTACPLAAARDRGPVSPVAAFARWLSAGLIPAGDCVTTTAECLRRGGVAIPRRVHTPVGLLRYLVRKGYAVVTGPPAS